MTAHEGGTFLNNLVSFKFP